MKKSILMYLLYVVGTITTTFATQNKSAIVKQIEKLDNSLEKVIKFAKESADQILYVNDERAEISQAVFVKFIGKDISSKEDYISLAILNTMQREFIISKKNEEIMQYIKESSIYKNEVNSIKMKESTNEFNDQKNLNKKLKDENEDLKNQNENLENQNENLENQNKNLKASHEKQLNKKLNNLLKKAGLKNVEITEKNAIILLVLSSAVITLMMRFLLSKIVGGKGSQGNGTSNKVDCLEEDDDEDEDYN